MFLFGGQGMCKNDTPEIFGLPEIITLEDYRGNIQEYIEAIYQVFVHDFVHNRPFFEGRRLGLKKHPLIEGKEYTFYHFTHEGNDEEDRIPDLRRMERMPWPAPIINNSSHKYLKVWRNQRGKHERILIFHEEEKYLVVLEDRGEYILPWTAYLVTYNNQIRRLLEEYEAYIKPKPPS